MDKLFVWWDYDIVLFCVWFFVRMFRGSKFDGYGVISSGVFFLFVMLFGFWCNECFLGLFSKMWFDLFCWGCSGFELFGIVCDNED